ncbi:MAG TPA: ABC transporter substrate-binding protein [Candidatus Limnocylindria bacterium]|nr:ABC transporter substrate-binding protein [Candidatus Limnocylindria bacterium]
MRIRRGLIRLIGPALAMLLLPSACGPASSSNSGSPSAASEQPVTGGQLIIGLQADPSPLNPNLTTNGPTQEIGTMIYEPLVYFDNEQAKPAPQLAKSWTISPDGLTYTFDLVDATFSDGAPLTSSDVKYTIEQVSAKTFAPFAPAAAAISNIDDKDPKKVVITLKRAFGPFLLSLTRVWILPKHVFGGTDVKTNPASLTAPVGTGPFILDKFTRGEQWTLVRNPKYWQKGKPYLNSIVGKVIPNVQSMVLAVSAGDVHYVSSQVIPASDAVQLQTKPNLALVKDSFAPNDSLMFFNMKRPLTANADVRHALVMAVDRQFIFQTVFNSFGKVATTQFDSRLASAANTSVNFDTMYPYDPKKAAAALDAAGYKPDASGKRFDITILVEAGSRFVAVAEAIRSMFKAIGVNATVDAPEVAVAADKAFKRGEFDIYLQSYTTNWDPALGIERAYVTSSIGTTFGNASSYSNPDVDKLFEQGRYGTTPEERGKYYKDAQTILAKDIPVFPLVETKLYDVAAKNVRGVWYAANWGEWERAWLAR